MRWQKNDINTNTLKNKMKIKTKTKTITNQTIYRNALKKYFQRILIHNWLRRNFFCVHNFCPFTLVQVHQHALFKRAFCERDRKVVKLATESVNQRHGCRLHEVADVGRDLTSVADGLECSKVEQAERVNDNLTSHTLNWVNDNSNTTLQKKV